MAAREEQKITELQKSHAVTGDVAEKQLAGILQKKGSFDGRLFCYKDKATYTYIYSGEVISLHFDRNKKALFFKGRHIESLDDIPRLAKHLEKFKKAMLETPDATDLVPSFDGLVSALLG